MSNRRKTRKTKPAPRWVKDYMTTYYDSLRCDHCTGKYERGKLVHDQGCPVLSGVVSFYGSEASAIADAAEKTGTIVIPADRLEDLLPTDSIPEGKVSARIREKPETALRSGTARLCPHLDPKVPPSKPAEAIWAAWDERFTCLPCHNALNWRTDETPENWTCDGCGKFDKKVRALMSDPSYPVVLTWGLCPACLAEDREPIGANA